MKRAIGILLVVAVALLFLNDVGRWVNAQSQLNEATAQLAEWAATSVHTDSSAVGRPLVTAEGTKRGVRVVQYESDQNTVRIWSSADVPGTWVIGPYTEVMKGTPLREAVGAMFLVNSYQQAQFQ